jgi:addiction module HigA family antidote
MSRKNPGHPGLLIAEGLKALDVSTVVAAKALGISRQALHKIIAGKSNITPEMAVRLELSIGSTAETWLSIQARHSLSQARLKAPEVVVLKEQTAA